MDPKQIHELVREVLPRVTAIRHDLHRHPELSFHEHRTSGVVQRELGALGIRFVGGLGAPNAGDKGTGVLGFLPATTPAAASTIALRADMDALPIQESAGENGRPHASCTPGVMHACGHDGHTSVLLGAAMVLSRLPQRPNNVLFVFQPAEEGGAGAEKMVRDGVLDGRVLGSRADMIFGLHGWPELELGAVETRDGPMLAATDDFVVTVQGRGCHAAQPNTGVDPIVVGAQIVTALQTISSRRFSPFEPIVVTVGQFNAGTANNIIPDQATLIGTVRTLSDRARALAEAEFRRIVFQSAQAAGASAHIAWHHGYPVTCNDSVATERVRSVARSLIPGAPLRDRAFPTMGGEDFAYYGSAARASFFFLGLRKSGSEIVNLHTPEFDFPDEVLPLGIAMMTGLAATPAI